LYISHGSFVYITIFVVFEFLSHSEITNLSAIINILLFSVLLLLTRSSAYSSC